MCAIYIYILYIYIYIYIYVKCVQYNMYNVTLVHTHTHTHTLPHIYIYIYIYRGGTCYLSLHLLKKICLVVKQKVFNYIFSLLLYYSSLYIICISIIYVTYKVFLSLNKISFTHVVDGLTFRAGATSAGRHFIQGVAASLPPLIQDCLR